MHLDVDLVVDLEDEDVAGGELIESIPQVGHHKGFHHVELRRCQRCLQRAPPQPFALLSTALCAAALCAAFTTITGGATTAHADLGRDFSGELHGKAHVLGHARSWAVRR